MEAKFALLIALGASFALSFICLLPSLLTHCWWYDEHNLVHPAQCQWCRLPQQCRNFVNKSKSKLDHLAYCWDRLRYDLKFSDKSPFGKPGNRLFTWTLPYDFVKDGKIAISWYFTKGHKYLCLTPRPPSDRRSGLMDFLLPRASVKNRLLGAPYDIRRKIYLALVRSDPVVSCIPTADLRPSKDFRAISALLHTCRQLRREFAPVLMARAFFILPSHHPFFHLRTFTSKQMRYLAVNVDENSLDSHAVRYSLLCFMGNLREVYLHFKSCAQFTREAAVAQIAMHGRGPKNNIQFIHVSVQCQYDELHGSDGVLAQLKALRPPHSKWRPCDWALYSRHLTFSVSEAIFRVLRRGYKAKGAGYLEEDLEKGFKF